MARFRFVAADSDGMLHDGSIDASTASDARNKLATNGLAVRELEEIDSTPGTISVEAPRRAAKAVGTPTPFVSARPSTREASTAVPRRGSAFPLVFSLLALIVAISTAAYVVYRDPPGGRLSKYDFSTPETAYASNLRIQATGDRQATLEMYLRLQGKQAREKPIRCVSTTQGKFEERQSCSSNTSGMGPPVREVAYLEKDPEQKFWKQTWIMPHELMQNDPHLVEEIQRWVTHPTDFFGIGDGFP